MNFYIAIALFFSYSLFAEAAEWTVDGEVNQLFAYDDNVTLSVNSVGSFYYRIIPEVKVGYDTDQFDFFALASYGTQKYENLTSRNLPIQRYSLSTSYQMGRHNFAFGANYTSDPNSNIAEADTGNFVSNSLRNRWSVSPSYAFQLTELDSLSLSGSYYETTYSGSGSELFSDNEVGVARLGWNREWSERLNTTIGFRYGHFSALGGGIFSVNTISDVYGIEFSSRYLMTKNWSINGGAGLRVVDSETILVAAGFAQADTDTSLGWDADLGIDYRGERLFGGFHFHKGLNPSGNGTLNDQTVIALNLGFNITERLTAELATSYRLTTTASVNTDLQRNNFDIGPSLNWAMARDWTLSASYRYRFQERDFVFVSTNADSNLVLLSLNYNWPGFSVSR
jgi:hypothetical protein